MSDSVFLTSIFEQKKTVDTLLSESRATGEFYLFLSFGAFITTLGLILNNPVVIIGAMLIAPILFPIMALGMGISTSSKEAIMRSLKILLRSIFVVFGISFVTAFLINSGDVTDQIKLASTPNFIFVMVAFFSGVIASYSWVRQEAQKTLPGVAVTVSLLPPLASVGIAVSLLSRDVFSGAILLFFINLIGIVFASILIFSLFNFSKVQKFQEEKIQKEIKEEEAEEEKKIKEKEEQDKKDNSH